MGGAHLRVKTLQRLNEALQTSEALLNKPTMQLFGFLKMGGERAWLGHKKKIRYLFKFWSERIVSDLQNVRNEFVCYYAVGHLEGSLSCDDHVTLSCENHVTYLPEIVYPSQVRIINNLRRRERKRRRRKKRKEDTCK